MIRRQDAWPLGALGFILAATAGWWALALWAVPGAPDWLERARSVCFNIQESGLPDTKGWLLLVGEPLGMLAVLSVGWARELKASLVHLASSKAGRATLSATALLVLAGLGVSAQRVLDARLPAIVLADVAGAVAQTRLDRPWPRAEGLVDQTGEAFSHARLEGRAALVTFAFGHCETVCPVIVHEARAARDALALDVSIVVLTVDPWRDTPGRLGALLEQFELDPRRDHVVGGDIDAVEAALAAWDIRIERDSRNGDVVHPATVYLVEPEGTVAYVSGGSSAQIVSLSERLGWSTRS